MTPFTTYIIPESSRKKTTGTDKWLWIVVDRPLSGPQNELLQKICEALKADFMKDTNVMIYSVESGIQLSELDTNAASLILSFGVIPSLLGIWIDLPVPGIRYLESYSLIYTVSLEELIDHPASKKALWSSMQSFLLSQKKQE
ncbi:MAG: hypothetical protein ABJC12_09595 [Saprospiraceae bacterium]